ncbi:SDR family NAD(P)-dependent oxidoreductase [Zhongshania sp. BJYM1]|uniref:SDR family NAD(P)-dependent oxidoreductase n=1 Tax=Zhongshania aquatica TaxID=2965069 RepID=UPI0022B4FD44|nr:SDR family NAD(P)-dependent oxidoreductase [Marortus sp. BJYM1]
MQEFSGKTIVVTGGASGVGFALCNRFGKEGMNVVVADIEQKALDKAVDTLKSSGINAIGVVTDVTSPASVENLAAKAYESFGNVHVLCNNAGVGVKEADRKIWALSANDWNWGYSVNVMGIANGIRAFVPKMLAAGLEGHIINTTSFNGGCIAFPTTPIYASSKAAVTSLTEVLYAQLSKESSKLKVHLLFPGPHMVNTQILASQRNRQAEFQDDVKVDDYMTMEDLKKSALGANVEFQLTEPVEVADACFEGVCNNNFWIRPYLDSHQAMITARCDSVLTNSNPAVM